MRLAEFTKQINRSTTKHKNKHFTSIISNNQSMNRLRNGRMAFEAQHGISFAKEQSSLTLIKFHSIQIRAYMIEELEESYQSSFLH
jgi:hypothetical protein